MPTTFLHMLDVHLGYQQHQSEEWPKDDSRVFRQTIEDAITRQVGFVVITGDLLYKAEINPITLRQAKPPLDQRRKPTSQLLLSAETTLAQAMVTDFHG